MHLRKSHFKRIMIFGRPGSGKSTFALWLSGALNLPLHHLDKHFYTKNWVERDYDEFLKIQQNIVNGNHWIIDGNSIRSLEMRWEKADLILYFNFSKMLCLWRILKRFLRPNTHIHDRAPGCSEVIRWPLVKYTWQFERRVAEQITTLKNRYPHTIFKEIRNDSDLKKLKNELKNTH